jgi:putative glycosyltransferase (TIGR04372 family)
LGSEHRPFQILGLLETHELGDLIANVVFLSTLANQFDHSRLHVKFRDVRPYSRHVMSLSPWIDVAEPFAGEWPMFVRRLVPQTKLLKPLFPMRVGSQKGKGTFVYDMIITSLMAREDAVHALPHPVPLCLPEAQRDRLCAGLVARGLKRDRWFAVFHYRESGYKYRPDRAGRDSDPAAFDGLVDHIISLGGQAVRLGHPGMAPFRARAGFVDLSKEADFLLQAAAVSYSRFMIAGPSGPMMLSAAFHIPHTFVDVVDTRAYWNVHQTEVLTHEVTTPSGAVLRNESLQAAGLLNVDRLTERVKAEPGYTIRKASRKELELAAKRLFDKTSDCTTWRRPATIPSGPKPNHVAWPLTPDCTTPWLDFDTSS